MIEVVTKTVEPLFLVENEYRLTLVEAERQFIDDLLRRIAEDQTYTRAWKSFHPEPCRTPRRQGKDRRDLYRGGSSHGDCDPDQMPKP